MRALGVPALLRDGVLDPSSAALLWLLVEGRVPLVVAGPAMAEERAAVAHALLSLDTAIEWVVIDADAGALTTERLAALLRGGAAVGVTVSAPDLEAVVARLEASGLPADAVRRLGVVAIVDDTQDGLRCTSVHYLRPTERDAQGHLQRRPPAVLAAWDGEVHEDFAWGITPELADRVDRSQADLEERRADRARFLARLGDREPAGELAEDVRAYLATEPPRTPSPGHAPAEPSPFQGGLLDADAHDHGHDDDH